jgi:adenylate kinase family enzyme
MSLYLKHIYPNNIYSSNIYNMQIYDPHNPALERARKKRELEEFKKQLFKRLKDTLRNIEIGLTTNFGDKAFLMGATIAVNWADKDIRTTTKYKGGNYQRSIILKTENPEEYLNLPPKPNMNPKKARKTDKDTEADVKKRQEEYNKEHEETVKRYNEIFVPYSDKIFDQINTPNITTNPVSFKLVDNRGHNQPISQAIREGYLTGAIFDSRDIIKERDDKPINETKEELRKWFDIEFPEKQFKYPARLDTSNLSILQHFKNVYKSLSQSKKNRLQKLGELILKGNVENYTLLNFLHGYAIGEQLLFTEVDEQIFSDKKEQLTDEDVFSEGTIRNFAGYDLYKSDSLNDYLGRAKIDYPEMLIL